MAEGITLKRIIDMDEAAELSSSDYALVDSATGGPKKFALGNELSQLKEELLANSGIASTIFPEEKYREAKKIICDGFRVQSVCRDSDNNVFYICCSSNAKDGTTKIIKTDSLLSVNGESESFTVSAGHSNDCAFYNGYLYIAAGADENGQPEGQNPINSIIKVDVNSRTVSEVITLSDVGADACNAIDYYDGRFFVSGFVYVYIYDTNWQLLEKHSMTTTPIQKLLGLSSFYRQSMVVNETYIIRAGAIYNTNSIFNMGFIAVYDKNYRLLDVLSFNTLVTEELEGIVLDGTDIYFVFDGNYYVVKKCSYVLSSNGSPYINPLAKNTNLNNVKTIGKYYTGSGSETNTLSNLPTGIPSAGLTLEVDIQSFNNIRQTLKLNGDGAFFYTRMYELASNVWRHWNQINTTKLT